MTVPKASFEVDRAQVASQVTIHGVLSNGIKYETTLPQDEHVGKSFDGWWIKGRVPLASPSRGEESHYLLSKKEGFTTTNAIVSREELARMAKVTAPPAGSTEASAACCCF